MTGWCGNDPRTQLTEGDRQVVEEFQHFLTVRAQIIKLDAELAAWTKGEPLPACPTCGAEPSNIRVRENRTLRRYDFDPCQHWLQLDLGLGVASPGGAR